MGATPLNLNVRTSPLRHCRIPSRRGLLSAFLAQQYAPAPMSDSRWKALPARVALDAVGRCDLRASLNSFIERAGFAPANRFGLFVTGNATVATRSMRLGVPPPLDKAVKEEAQTAR